MKKDQGQATVLAVAALALSLAMVMALVRLGSELLRQARAAAAADAAALAALTGGRAAAAQVAAANSAVLVELQTGPDRVTATVVVDSHRATSSAALVE